jgi:transposase
LSALIEELSSRVEEQMRPFPASSTSFETIAGVGQSVAEVIVAETGAGMSRFRTAGHLASCAGICPGHRESAGKPDRARPVTATGGCAEPWEPPPWP